MALAKSARMNAGIVVMSLLLLPPRSWAILAASADAAGAGRPLPVSEAVMADWNRVISSVPKMAISASAISATGMLIQKISRQPQWADSWIR